MSTSVPSPQQASTSLHPNSLTPAMYHPQPRPPPLPFNRADTHSIKQELHDALGENGLPYWKAMNGYLLGQIGKGELEGMVRGWLKGDKLELHNKLLLSLLNNAGAPPQHHQPISPLTQLRKRKRVAPDDPEFDIDETTIEPKTRVQQWVMGMGSRERARVRRAVIGKQTEEDVDAEVDEVLLGKKNAGKWGSFAPSSLIPPLALPNRLLPSSQQLSMRLSQFAKTYDMSLAPDAQADIGEFMAVGMDTHLGDVFHGIVHLTGRHRPGGGTIRVPRGLQARENGHAHGYASNFMDVDGISGEDLINNSRSVAGGEGDMPKPDLATLQYLLALNPSLHPQASPAVLRLETSHTLAEVEANTPHTKPAPHSVFGRPSTGTVTGINRADAVAQNLLSTGLLKLDKAGRQSEIDGGADGKKERKHNLHWKYEDPALILKDVLG
ncbi:hypothetical protein CI109_102808 [Kwoniella shandongensis]|uniref:Uncharacterized protein n=1 Tax=Kwoniella shandongensis TaxID=1734106 RepID=A0A5M6BQF3_9TREE|nr:uncharacterized protein CI109_007445 [Kwoniella shandongensis]KAA5524220.1 hypothetical protein CI109_007445 [Kwoniella shandongensis]